MNFEKFKKNIKKGDVFFIVFEEMQKDIVISKVISIKSDGIFFKDQYAIQGMIDPYWHISKHNFNSLKVIKKLKYKRIETIKKYYPQYFI